MKKIERCVIIKGKTMNIISVIYDDGSTDERLNWYYPDEIYFTEKEFIGLTEKEARDLMRLREIECSRK